jgi:hypothetical protein
MASQNQSISTSSINRNEQTLTNIQSLQNSEQDLFTQLEENIANNTLTPELQQKLTEQISKLTELRVNLYGFLNSSSKNTVGHLASANTLYGQQAQTVTVVEKELNETKRRLQELIDIKSNNLRMVEINKYYGDKYQDQTHFMVTIVIISIVLILVKFLHNRNILPESVYSILLIIILTVGFIILFWKMVYLYAHDNFDYSKYKWTFNTETAPTVDTTNPNGENPWKLPEIPDASVCTNASKYCGDGTTFDSTQSMCVPLTADTSASPAEIVDEYTSGTGDYSYESLMNNLGY